MHASAAGTSGAADGSPSQHRRFATLAGGDPDAVDGWSGEAWNGSLADLLGEVPPEASLDGPPDDDLVLRRTLRQMRAETAAHRRRCPVPAWSPPQPRSSRCSLAG